MVLKHHTWLRTRWLGRKPRPGLLGKAPATDFGPANVTFQLVQAADLPVAPLSFGHGKMFSDWGMLGNDAVGDCAFAGPAHEHMAWTGIGNRGADSAVFTTAGVLSDYSALTGYDPSDPSTDRGTDVSQLMDYRRTRGLIDATGKRHQIDLAVRLEQTWDQYIRALWAFKAVAIGFQVPGSAMQQFKDGQPWDYVGDQNTKGGHYVPGLGSPAKDNLTAVVTWGKRQLMTRSFFEAYVDELWVPLSREAMASIETSLSVVDWASVERIAGTLT